MRGLLHGAPPGWPPSAALLSCFLQANTQRPTRSKKPAIRLRDTDWCLRLPIVRLPAPALGWHGAFGGGGPFHDVAGPGFDWAEVQDMKPG